MNLREYQNEACKTDQASGSDLASIMVPLLGLAGESGSLLTEYKKWLREGDRYKPFTDQVSEEIGDILWYLANIASKLNLDLSEIAAENLAKTRDRWPVAEDRSPLLFPEGSRRYDGQFPANEQLPRKLRIEFRENRTAAGVKLELSCDRRQLGDPLTDNSHIDDGYRFHDVFHLTNAIMLGWSPVTRKLLRCKRKSVPQIDEVEDGARAAVLEEAISAFVFGYARDYSFFEGSSTIEYELLRTIRIMTRPFEVRDRPSREWERAILAGYAVWREMRANHGGCFVGDAESVTVRYEPLPSTV
ncbi:MAG: hypothetical protein B6D36_17050 [Planctomycetes bacterium UTPLA1]|nr:MAG: hypothetical protein B6D36_17050 [Planctomycetes bacterium UTPLA1]